MDAIMIHFNSKQSPNCSSLNVVMQSGSADGNRQSGCWERFVLIGFIVRGLSLCGGSLTLLCLFAVMSSPSPSLSERDPLKRDALSQSLVQWSVVGEGEKLSLRRGSSEIVTIDLKSNSLETLWPGNRLSIIDSAVCENGRSMILYIESNEILLLRDQQILFAETLLSNEITTRGDESALIAISANGLVAARVFNGQLRKWDLNAEEVKIVDYPIQEFIGSLPIRTEYCIESNEETTPEYFYRNPEIQKIAFNFDGSQLLLLSSKKGVLVSALDHQQAVWSPLPALKSQLLAGPVFLRDDSGVMIAWGASIILYNHHSRSVEWNFQLPSNDPALGIAVSPNNQWIAVRSVAESLAILSRIDGSLHQSIPTSTMLVGCVFTPDSQSLLLLSVNGSVAVATHHQESGENPFSPQIPDPEMSKLFAQNSTVIAVK